VIIRMAPNIAATYASTGTSSTTASTVPRCGVCRIKAATSITPK
jgi:hypothetical protein